MINSHTHNLKKKHTSGLEQYSDFINVYIASLLMGLSAQNWKFIYQFTMKKKIKTQQGVNSPSAIEPVSFEWFVAKLCELTIDI